LVQNNAKDTCRGLGLGFDVDNSMMNVVIHVRNGDICAHCNDVSWIKNITANVLYILDMNEQDVNQKVRFHIESKLILEKFEDAVKNVEYSRGGNSLSKTVCKILTSDFFVSSGSSMGK
jgi:hypothetical protein